MSKPLVLTIDDDATTNLILGKLLRRMGIASQSFEQCESFLKAIPILKPHLCLIDLNIEKKGVGYVLIQAIRKMCGSLPHILVVSGMNDSQSIEKAMKLGANDYVLKPIDRKTFLGKLIRHLKTENLSLEVNNLFRIPKGGVEVDLKLEIKINGILENGFEITSPHLFMKNHVFFLEGNQLEQMTGRKKVLVKITESWHSNAGNTYHSYAEVDESDLELMKSLRRYLLISAKR